MEIAPTCVPIPLHESVSFQYHFDLTGVMIRS